MHRHRPLAHALGALTLPQLYITTLINGCFTVFFDVGVSAYVPALVGPAQLVAANSKLELSRSAAQIVGPGTAGLLIEWATAPIALLADAVSFLVSASFLSRIRRREHATIAHKQPLSSFAREVAAGIGYVFRQPYLRVIALTALLANLFRSTLLTVLLIYLVREAHESPSAIGLAFALGNIGFLTGAATAAGLSRRFGVGRTMHGAVASFGPAALIVAVAPTQLALYAIGTMILIDSFGVVVHGVNQISLRQAITPEHLRGRMTATIRFLIFGAIPLGTTMGGILGSTLGVRQAIWTATVGLFVAALPYTFSPIRRLISIPGTDEAHAQSPPTAAADDP